MQETKDNVDLEHLWSLGENHELTCESPHHTALPDNKINFHADGGPLWYVHFIKWCHCAPGPIQIRCDYWAKAYEKMSLPCSCSCGGTWQAIVLDQVQNS